LNKQLFLAVIWHILEDCFFKLKIIDYVVLMKYGYFVESE